VGHVEVLEMGVVSADIKLDCESLTELWTDGAWATDPSTHMSAPSGGLSGSSVFINPSKAYAISMPPTAIDGWALDGVSYHKGPGTLLPTLDQGSSVASVFTGEEHVEITMSNSIDATSAILASAFVSNEVVVEDVIAAETDWVLTFPTKKYYTNGEVAVAPFTKVYDGEEELACEEFSLSLYDRSSEEATSTASGFIPQEEEPTTVCDSVSVLSFTDTSALLSDNAIKIDYPFQAGMATLAFSQSLDGEAVEVTGLPVIGFSATRIVNGDMSYGNSSVHKTNVVTSN
jgi:hypothetical protein